ncbi:hypothetical protein M405DRAFT_869603 [Rhizopogon salebrosus TDB-379]|nr:hypothetical protein M405DRAFT_869603 [Rhizopogon salebrosus TDB-379]
MEIRLNLKDIPAHVRMRRAHTRKDLGRNREHTGDAGNAKYDTSIGRTQVTQFTKTIMKLMGSTSHTHGPSAVEHFLHTQYKDNPDVKEDITAQIKNNPGYRETSRISLLCSEAAKAMAARGEEFINHMEMEAKIECEHWADQVKAEQEALCNPTDSLKLQFIEGLGGVVGQLLDTIHETTGWHGSVYLGGPDPRVCREVHVFSFHHGKGPTGFNFCDTFPDHHGHIIEPFTAFLKGTFSANTSYRMVSETMPDTTESAKPDSMAASSLSISDIMLPANPSVQPDYQATFSPSLPDATLPTNLAHSIETLTDFSSIDPSYGVNMLALQSSTSLVEELSYDDLLLNGVQPEHTPHMLSFKPDVPSLLLDPSVIDPSLSFDFSAIDSFNPSFFTSSAPTVALDTPITSWNRDVAAGNLPFISPPRFRGAFARIGSRSPSGAPKSQPLPCPVTKGGSHLSLYDQFSDSPSAPSPDMHRASALHPTSCNHTPVQSTQLPTIVQPAPLPTMALQVAAAISTPVNELGAMSDQALNNQTHMNMDDIMSHTPIQSAILPTTVQPAPLSTMALQVATAMSTLMDELGATLDQAPNDKTHGMNMDGITQPLDDIVSNEPCRSA